MKDDRFEIRGIARTLWSVSFKTAQTIIFVGKVVGQKDFIAIELPVLLFEEDGIFYASLPALDIIGYGKSEEEAKASLRVMTDEFIKDAATDNILEGELMKLGWKKIPVESPSLFDSILHNEELQELINSKSIRTDRIGINIPAFA